MGQEIKDLIAKIQREGVDAAKEQAEKIKADADLQAQKIISAAKSEAKEIVEAAAAQVKKLEASGKASLSQSGRDLLISLRKEINSMLNNLIKEDLGRALTAEELSGFVGTLIKSTHLSLDSEIIVFLNEKDKEKLERGFLSRLAQETRKQVVLKAVNNIDSGFIISFDAGKSVFDFSSQALAEYLSGSLKPELDRILKSE